MKFIDLYNQNKDCADFKHRQQKFKMYCYLMKKNPGEFDIKWDSKVDYFRYCQNVNEFFEGEFVCTRWAEKDNSNDKHKTMGDYNKF